ncbi:MAG: BON domain-containing protein [Gemmatimonadales bacterium]|jgi:osmotically-inducible protein OsmY
MRTRDAELHCRVLTELESHADLGKQEIGISVHDGVVTLSGQIDTYEQKFAAEQLVAQIPGIAAVAVDLRVGKPGDHDLTDTEIAHAMADYLRWYFSGGRKRIIGKVERGWITLVGEVDFERQRAAVEESVNQIPGVRGVVNMITVKPVSERDAAAEYEVTSENHGR